MSLTPSTISPEGARKKSWLLEHLEGFAASYLGYVPRLPDDYRRVFQPQDMAVIKGMWKVVKREAKKQGRPILLAGRDVFIFEILARREGYPTVFRPDISRKTVQYVREDYSKHFLFDTGFIGSIPRGLDIPENQYILASWSSNKDSFRFGVAQRPLIGTSNQVFPRLSGSRSLALTIENTPKYWKTGFARLNGTHSYYQIGQELTDKDEFLRAAHLTIEVYKDSSPSFVETRTKMLRSRSKNWLDMTPSWEPFEW